MVMIHKIAEFAGLPLLAVEAGFLLLLTIIFVIVVLLVLAIFRIKNELIKISYTTNYMTRLIIIKNIYVSKEYAEMIKGLAEEEGLLPKKTD
jgi:hypothetical protein